MWSGNKEVSRGSKDSVDGIPKSCIASILREASFHNYTPIVTQTIDKPIDTDIVYSATVYKEGFIRYTKYVKLSPEEMEKVHQLRRDIEVNPPHCCPDVPNSWAGSKLTLHYPDKPKVYYTYGSCRVDIDDDVKDYRDLYEFLDEKFKEDLWKDNKYKSCKWSHWE